MTNEVGSYIGLAKDRVSLVVEGKSKGIDIEPILKMDIKKTIRVGSRKSQVKF